ncbi:MAG: hypothetical protein JSS62_01935 [Verrucomicrobia bacterium]|nr:hypothetical protein [Verrucomicrobiota bacterium]MBS0645534.1 hypothetical protein [Verrucomicrobiota bacterium]
MTRRFTLISVILLVVISGFLTFVGFLPSILSTPKGTQWLLKRINHHIPGKIELSQLKISWMGEQYIEGLQVYNQDGLLVAGFKILHTQTPLLEFLTKHPRLGSTYLDQPYLYYNREQELNKEQSKPKVHKFPRTKTKYRLPRLEGSVTVLNGTLLFASPSLKPVKVHQLNFHYQFEQDVFDLNALADQQDIQGEIFANGNLANKLHILAELTHVPVSILDQLKGKNIFSTAIGETIDCRAETIQQDNGYIITSTISSSNLNGVLKAEMVDQTFVFSPDSELVFNLTPSAFHTLLGPSQQLQWKLSSKTPIIARIEEGHIPISPKDWDLDNIQLRILLQLERAELLHHVMGPYTISDLTANILLHQQIKTRVAGHILGQENSHFLANFLISETGKFTYHLTSQNFPFILLDLVMDDSEILRDFLGTTISLNLDGSYEKGFLKTILSLQSSLTDLQATLEGSSLQDLDFYIKGSRLLFHQWQRILGHDLAFSFQGKASIGNKNLALSTVSGNLKNETMNIDVKGRIGESDQPFSYKQILLTAQGKLLDLPYHNVFPQTTLKHGEFTLHLNGEDNLLQSNLDIIVSIDHEEGIIDSKTSHVEVSVKNALSDEGFNFKDAEIELSADLQHFPVAILDLFIPGDFDSTLLTGPVMDAKIQGHYDHQSSQHLALINLDAHSEGLDAHLAFEIDGSLSVTQPEPSTIHLNLSPKRYEGLVAWFRPEYRTEFTLVSNPTIDIALTEFRCPTQLPQEFSQFICQSGLVGSIHISPFVFKKQQELFAIQQVQGFIQARNFSDTISINLQSSLVGSNSQKPASLSFVGEVKNLWDQEGQLSLKTMSVHGEMDAHLIPIRQILGIIPMEAQTRTVSRAFLGDVLDAHMVGNITHGVGPFTLDLQSSNFKAILPLQLTQQAILLRDFVEAEITLTDEVSEALLVDVNPLLITGASSDHPLKLYIDPQNFSIAIHPFFFKGVHIERAILDIGKIRVRNGGQIQSLLHFLKVTDISDDKWMDAWFTPIFMSLNDGTSSYKRFDILLANEVHIALWGRIDLVKSKVWMTLGIAPSTLAQRFNIVGLTKKEMFQVKMRGKTDNVELDWSSAYTRIGIIIARIAGGHIGYLVGGVVEQLFSAFGEEATPPPSTSPLPWESMYPSEPGEKIPEEAAKPSMKKRGLRKALEFLIP